MLPHAIERFVFIDHDEKGVRRYSIYDEAYRLLYSTVCGIGADKRLQQKKKADIAMLYDFMLLLEKGAFYLAGERMKAPQFLTA